MEYNAVSSEEVWIGTRIKETNLGVTDAKP
jgi:hypothetical protein